MRFLRLGFFLTAGHLPLTTYRLPLSNANVCVGRPSSLFSAYHAQMVIEGPYKNYLSWGCRACSLVAVVVVIQYYSFLVHW